jgi:hypothetical protein
MVYLNSIRNNFSDLEKDMKNLKNICLHVIFMATLALALTGCDSNVGDGDGASGTSGKLVDPYIIGAVLCQDTNGNNKCDEGEPVSTPTTATGDFSFSEFLTPGRKVSTKVKGDHVGKKYGVTLAGVVADDGSIAVISPLTTLLASDLTPDQVAEILNQAAKDSTSDVLKDGKWEISAADILNDPIGNGLMDKTFSQVNDIELRNVQASLAVYGLIRVMKKAGATVNTSPEIIESGKSGGDINKVTKKFLEIVSTHITGSKLKNMEGPVSGVELPEPKMGLIVEVAVRIMDALADAGVAAAKAAKGTTNDPVDKAITAIGAKETILAEEAVNEMALTMYGFRNKAVISSSAVAGLRTEAEATTTSSGNRAKAILTGIDADTAVKTFEFDSNDGSVIAYQ